MEIFPAIDIRGGRVVRLTEGDYGAMKVYGDAPADTAAGFYEQGARNLHVVDLDGAKDGRAVNFDAIRAVCARRGLFIEVGGGIRDEARIERYLALGVGRVILGTVAVQNFRFVEDMVKKYGERIAVGVDARAGRVAVQGWLDVTDVDSFEFCGRLRDAGVATVIYTDIARDGRLGGANLSAYRRLASFAPLHIVASGGISFERELLELRAIGTYAAILGKALYEGKLSLPRAVAIGDGSNDNCGDGDSNGDRGDGGSKNEVRK
ncbi:MAG: 1-(5-phosphoribosyl)-5-[(5-phosphoribosylamino)methylideneamino]imidazole-4-carboxamide isomerase [Clostridiales bacterium]|jgi:phosphoribosylformimino-5-aminoimidazole carboxamide ribotide isomerase|nr:1-(5-phosphoribosyl)-5-[(5-phosphoribosylamino)methylideneamino]imidazole-4-carboxamide isomerase [Clostridiales bacterium]